MKLFIILFSFIKSLFTVEPIQKSTSFPLKLDLQFFAEDPDPDEDDDDDDKGGKDKKDKPFAQFNSKEELNKRLTRAENAGKKALAKELGFDSVEAMQASLKKDGKQTTKEDDTTPPDVDKIIEDKLKEERAKGFKRILNSEVKLVANELGFADYEDALALADLSEVKENDKGDLEGVKEALKALAEKKPHLLKKTGTIGSDINQKRKNSEHLEGIKKLAQSRGTQTTTVNDPWSKR